MSPSAHAQVITTTTTTTRQKAAGVLGSVVGLNMNAYAAALTADSNTTSLSLPQEDVTFKLTAAQSSLRARCSFINGTLNQIYLSDYVGSPSLSQPTTNTLDAAKGFLQRYQSYTGNQFYGSLSSMLNNVTLNANATETEGNVRLQASVVGNQTQNLIWTYVDNNGVPALMKDVVLTYRNGHLESFLDNWQLYTIEGAPTISSQDAIAAALQTVSNFSYAVENASGANIIVSGFKVAAVFNVSLSYLNYFEQTPLQSIRGGDPYVLYPSWYVGIGFDKVYPGDVTGLNIRVWADTGNVSSAEPMIVNPAVLTASGVASSNTPVVQSQINSMSMTLVLLSIIVAVAGSLTTSYLYTSKNTLSRFKQALKITRSRRKIIAICLVILPVALIVAVPSVFASTSYKAETYISTAGYTTMQNSTFVNGEIQMSKNVGADINGNFTNAGVLSYEYPFNNDSTNGNYNTIIDNIQSDETNNSQDVSVFAFGNGYYPTFILTDLNQSAGGVNLFYENISAATGGNDRIIFAWMWACTLAGTTLNPNGGGTINYGFADAWTNTTLSDNQGYDGFNYPDNSSHAFIGFDSEAPMISYNSFQNYTQLAHSFIEYFYEAATSHYTVHDSLNLASEALFGVPYGNSPLYLSYYTWWPGGDNYTAGYDFAGAMMVYGDSNIYISSGGPETVGAPTFPGSQYGSPNTPYQLSVSSTDSDGYNVSYMINWGDNSAWTTTGSYVSGDTANIDHTYSSGGNYTVTVYAISQDGVWSSASTYTVIISGPYLITVTAADGYGELYGVNVYIDGSGTPIGSAPTSFYLSGGYHTITFDGYAWDGYINSYVPFDLMYDGNSGNWYGNGASIQITSADSIEAWYSA